MVANPIPLSPNPALYLSPEMVHELALGMDAPHDVAARYGISNTEFGQLQAQTWFGEMVMRRRMELDAEGVTFKAKAKAVWVRGLRMTRLRRACGGSDSGVLLIARGPGNRFGGEVYTGAKARMTRGRARRYSGKAGGQYLVTRDNPVRTGAV